MIIRPLLAFLMLISAISLVGCGTNDPYADLKVRMEEIKKRPKGRVKPPPEFKTYQNFIYSASLLRSPFQPPIEIEPLPLVPQGKKVTPDFNRTPELLEEFSIEALSMVGTISKPNDTLFALIRDNRAGIHRVSEGNYIGRNHGKVVGISVTKIDIVELIPDGQDGWVERPRSMVLRDD